MSLVPSPRRRTLQARDLRLAIVASRFNPRVTERLLKNCLRTLSTHGANQDGLTVVRVPGAYEIPWAAQELALSRRFDAVICLGAILKGRTPQNNHIASAVIHHLTRISLASRVPVILGIITPNTYRQAMARTQGHLDRGREAALAAIDMAILAARRTSALHVTRRHLPRRRLRRKGR